MAAHLQAMQALVVTAILFVVEIPANGWRNSSLRRLIRGFDRSQAADLVFCLIGVLGLLGIVEIVLTLGLGYGAMVLSQATLRGATGLNLRIDTRSPMVNLGIYFVIWSLIYYWTHRLEHFGPFWLLHRMHHSATSMSPLVRFRANPAEQVIDRLLKVWPVAFVAAPDSSLAIFVILVSLYESLSHANVPWTWGWFGRWIVLSPAAHRVHHSALAEHRDKNFGPIVLWDRLFGTWVEPTNSDYPLGVADADHNHAFVLRECLADIWLFCNAITRLRKGYSPASPQRQPSPEAKLPALGNTLTAVTTVVASRPPASWPLTMLPPLPESIK